MSLTSYLSDFGLRKTRFRIDLLSVLYNSSCALSEKQIKDRLSVSYNRSTLYRLMKILKEKRIIHTIKGKDSIIYYAFTRNSNHIHFECHYCSLIICLDNIKTNKIILPEGYVASISNLVVEGSCDNCSTM